MSVQAIAWVFEKSKHGGSARLVLLTIANHCYSNGKGGDISIADISFESRMAKRTVQWIIARKLIPSGELRVYRHTRQKKLGLASNLYEIPGVERDGFHLRGRPEGKSDGAKIAPSLAQSTASDGAIAIAPHKEPKESEVKTKRLRARQASLYL